VSVTQLKRLWIFSSLAPLWLCLKLHVYPTMILIYHCILRYNVAMFYSWFYLVQEKNFCKKARNCAKNSQEMCKSYLYIVKFLEHVWLTVRDGKLLQKAEVFSLINQFLGFLNFFPASYRSYLISYVNKWIHWPLSCKQFLSEHFAENRCDIRLWCVNLCTFSGHPI